MIRVQVLYCEVELSVIMICFQFQGLEVAQLVQHQTHDQNVVGLIPDRSRRRFSSPELTFVS